MINLSFQSLAYEKFSKMRVGALFMKMGSGKTKVAVDIANSNVDKVDRLIWICPNQVKDSTIKELKKWSPRMRFRVIAYESLSQSERIFNDAMSYAKAGKPFLVLDESIFVKNGKTLRWQRCKAIRVLCPFCLILNGTPVVKNEWDLYWQMNMLDERIIPYNEPDFRRLFFDEKTIRARGRRGSFVKYEFSKKNANALAKMIAPYTFKVDVDYGIAAEDKTISVKPMPMTQVDYAGLKAKALHNAGSLMQFMSVLGGMVMLMSCDANRIAKTAELAKNRPVIIYAKYRDEVYAIRKALNDNCYCITGSTPANERRTMLNLFELMQDRPLILTFGTGSYGLNLQFANEVIFNSYDWNYGTLEQAKARVLRIGQSKTVHFTFVELDLPIQQLVKRCVMNKDSMADFVKNQLIDRAKELL